MSENVLHVENITMQFGGVVAVKTSGFVQSPIFALTTSGRTSSTALSSLSTTMISHFSLERLRHK